MAVIKWKERGKIRLWANLRYSTAICLGVLRNNTKKLRFLYLGLDSNRTPPKHFRNVTDSGTATLLCRIPMYQEPIPDEFVIYAGHVVLLRQSDPRHIDRAGQISERNS
jgi:hypothetical protein